MKAVSGASGRLGSKPAHASFLNRKGELPAGDAAETSDPTRPYLWLALCVAFAAAALILTLTGRRRRTR